ncbi:hypothetical protein R9C00_03050 [Flammeovirgaceae bacterium SG7u.111]|nr:hypothetical protein [Flammeovirgaceae bacterium SG7u.132]WPO36419.1 hypothetical protein R9C00_03050 [Flammeovirgaceae bacterium SG7u.111]
MFTRVHAYQFLFLLMLIPSISCGQNSYLSIELGQVLVPGVGFDNGAVIGGAYSYKSKSWLGASLQTNLFLTSYETTEWDDTKAIGLESETYVGHRVPTISLGPEFFIETGIDVFFVASPRVGYAWQLMEISHHVYGDPPANGNGFWEVSDSYHSKQASGFFYYGLGLGLRFYVDEGKRAMVGNIELRCHRLRKGNGRDFARWIFKEAFVRR